MEPDFSTIEPLWLLGPIGLALLILAIFGWRRKKANKARKHQDQERLQRIQSARIPEGAAYIVTDNAPRELRSSLIGAYLLVAIGGFGLNQVLRTLTLLAQCGLEQIVGAILIIENDAQQRAEFHRRVPPVFQDRIVYGFSEAYSGGGANRSPESAFDHIDAWGGAALEATSQVIDVYLRRNHNRAPAVIGLFQSLGWHSAVGVPVMDMLHDRFEGSLAIGAVALPRHGRLRQRFATLKPEFEKHGVAGWLLTDNLGTDPTTADYGMVALIVALADAALYADQATQPNNTLSLALTEEPGAILIYQVVATSVVGYPFQPDPSVMPKYYVLHQPVVEEATKTLRRIEEGKGLWSADLPVGEHGTSTFDVLMVSLYHQNLTKVEDEVRAARRLRQQYAGLARGKHDETPASLYGQANYETIAASIAAVIDPQKPVCPVVAVRLTAVRHGKDLVPEIVQAPQDRRLPAASGMALPAHTQQPVQKEQSL